MITFLEYFHIKNPVFFKTPYFSIFFSDLSNFVTNLISKNQFLEQK